MRMPPSPPNCPDGWHIAPPDVVGVGAQRSSTTWWYGLLAAHPEFCRVPEAPKELHFFDRCLDEGLATDEPERYARYFPRRPGALSGEWTPRYMFDFWTPACLQACAPQARLLVMLRDPVERFHSGMAAHRESMRRRGREVDPLAPAVHVARSRYHEQLARLTRHFERDQILVLQHERCVLAPERELARTYEFVGLAPFAPDPAALRTRVNAAPPGAAVSLSPAVEAALRGTLADDLSLLAGAYPELDLGLWHAASALVS
ncbi:MAG TPA: sulfotransferase [Solirubrobacterales bacterium]|nr:sulfotransferase [Solirubrobacterales bacterium]